MAQVVVVLACILASTMAEPPVSSQYGTPSSPSGLSGQYGVPGRFGGQDSKGNYANAAGQYSATGNGEDGSSEPANYEFQYDVEERDSGLKFGHQEARQGEVAQGKYYVLLPDGRTQVVEYVADQDGYHPMISYLDDDTGSNGQNEYSAGRNSGYATGKGGYSNGGPINQGYSNGNFKNQGGYSNGGPLNQGYSSGNYKNQGGSPNGSNDFDSNIQKGYNR